MLSSLSSTIFKLNFKCRISMYFCKSTYVYITFTMLPFKRLASVNLGLYHICFHFFTDNRNSYRDYLYNLDKLAIYVDNEGGKTSVDSPTNLCGFISRYEFLRKPEAFCNLHTFLYNYNIVYDVC